jgi:hypothetical protein
MHLRDEGQTMAEQGREMWVRGTLDLCIYLAEARAKFKGNDRAFGGWLDDNEIKLNAMDRAAAIAMGENPVTTLAVLEATERKSLQHIHREEFQPIFIHANKDAAPGLAAPSNSAPPPQAAASEPKAKAEADIGQAGWPRCWPAGRHVRHQQEARL